MPQYEFTLLVDGDISTLAPDARCETNATVPGSAGPCWLRTNREAPCLAEAVISALQEFVVPGAEVVGLAPGPNCPPDSATVRQIIAADHQVRSRRLLKTESERTELAGLNEYLLTT